MTTATQPTRALPARTLRNTDVSTLYGVLQDQRAHTVDLVVPTGNLKFEGGALVVEGEAPELTDAGFFELNGLYRPVPSVDSQLDSVLDMPAKYIRKLRGENPGLLDYNLNTLAGMVADANPNQKQLVRLLWGEDSNLPGYTGIVRAILSNGYRIQDNLDTLMAVMAGLNQAGLGIEAVKAVDLSNDRLYLSVEAPGVAIAATELLDGYRDNRSGQFSREVGDIVSAGIIFSNSEVGSGSFSITPVIWALICKNGMVQKVDAMARRHVGGRLDEGRIDWSDDTRIKANQFISAQVRDATETFLSADYVETAVRRMEADAGVAISKPNETIERVSKALGYTLAEQEAILANFCSSAQMTSGGVMQAVTRTVQDFEDADRAYAVGATGVEAMKVAKEFALANA